MKENRNAAIVAYFTIIGTVIAIFMNNDENKSEYASFHIRQGLGLTLTFITLGLTISHFDNIMIAAPMWIFISILTIYGIFSAAKGETTPLPLLGKWFQKWFQNF